MKSLKVQKKSDCKICLTHDSLSIPFSIKSKNFLVREAESEKNCPGYLYIEPKRHIESFAELSHDEFSEFGSVMEESVRCVILGYPKFRLKKKHTGKKKKNCYNM